ncbi:zinc finger MYM-type protein 1-like [Leptopilina heterotoma]|uniref:zinc finger MYM-type protein 1-like n=1 Tax=Leptopilina heterotoma TaxID=63436 RepID=UPI001CA8B9FC|nr:zinc finger MYM-type protein 1-like [Leptopilina heterotoma]
MNYKHASGSEKRKKRKIQEESVNKLPKITNFFNSKTDEDVTLDLNKKTEIDSTFKTNSDQSDSCLQNCSNKTDGLLISDSLDINLTEHHNEDDKENEIKNQNETSVENKLVDEIPKISEWSATIIKNKEFLNLVIKNKPNSDSIDVKDLEQTYQDANRTYTRALKTSDFYRLKSNGGKEKREWLIYDSSTKSLYCYPCKLFSTDVTCSLTSSCGFNDWRNISRTLKNHEESKSHLAATVTLITRSSEFGVLDTKLQQQISVEEKYWSKFLLRVLATIKFLSKQGLAFRGSDENLKSQHKGNYLSCLTYLSEFDEFLEEHLRRYGNQGKGCTSYLSHQICDEFILLLRDKLINTFVDEIKSAKYFSIIVDSTPDISHCDQLTFVIRYIHKNEIKERFMGFLKIESHSAENLQEVVLKKLKELDLDIANCRGQSYDNAANMSGKYHGLQARIKNLSPTAFYVPCTNHSLNLVLNFACESCLQVVIYFDFVQKIFTFFSASTHRWNILKENCKTVPKQLSNTRWSARHDAVSVLKKEYGLIQDVLFNFSSDLNEKTLARSEALGLFKNMEIFETFFLTIVWDKLLERINATSKALENPNLNLTYGVQLLESLLLFIEEMRSTFDKIENETKILLDIEEVQYQNEKKRTRKRKAFFDEIRQNETLLTGRENFKINVFYVMCDGLTAELRRRLSSYSEVIKCFNCFFTNKEEEIEESLSKIRETYHDDIEPDHLDQEFKHFKVLCENTKVHEIFKKLDLAQNIRSTFPNIVTLIEIFLTIPLSNASAERSFSALKRVKTYLRSRMGQNRLDALSVMHIERESLDDINYDDIIKDFASKKARKVYI